MLTAGSARGTASAGTGAAGFRPPRWQAEVLLGLALFGVYILVKVFALPGAHARALSNGQDVLAAERALGLDFELPINLWLADQGWLRIAANYEYAYTYIVTTLVLLVWVFVRRPEQYRWVRDSFVWMNLVSLAVFWVYPVAPPRMLTEFGFVDTVRLGPTWGSWGSPLVDSANQLAAMPSLHIGWALWTSVVLARLSGGRLVQIASALHVVLTFVVIVATGNHYWLDAVGGVLVVWLGMVPARRARERAERAGPHAGGLVVLLEAGDPGPSAAGVRAVLAERLPARMRRRRDHAGLWPRARREPDWAWHVPELDATTPDGEPGGLAVVHRLAAELAAEPWPRDRPPWRCALVTGVADDVAALVVLVHRAAGDETTAADLLRSVTREGRAVPPARGAASGPFGTVVLDRDRLDVPARQHAVPAADVLRCAVAGALRRVCPGPLPEALSVAVSGEPTAPLAAVPLDDLPETWRLTGIARLHGLRTRAGGLVRRVAGPHTPVCLGEVPVRTVLPLPLPAPGALVTLTALDWANSVTIGVLLDPAAGGDVERFLKEFRAVLDELHLDLRRG
ncbi:phosphatase PAP2 family protein [Prauserella oleivorans]|uniref:Phosphatase PAP2 family protein n=1 Tax=Prauserella oleivorans TaxID=1478153 RepID=A0ABW5W454_9PSEU